MLRYGVLMIAGLFLATAPAMSGQTTEEKGTYLGILFGPVPEALYDQVPQLPRDRGVLVTHILPDSPAAVAELRRHDIILSYDDEKIRDCEHLARLIQGDKPDRKVKLLLLRAGKEQTIDVTLGLGPVLKIAQDTRNGRDTADLPKGTAKGNGPAPVSVSATPLDNGKMRVTIEYYKEGTGKLQTIPCEGTPADIDREIQKLPERERKLADAAIQRIRVQLAAQKPLEKK
jgi:hypothetical protein